jgi:hypothetical protein
LLESLRVSDVLTDRLAIETEEVGVGSWDAAADGFETRLEELGGGSEGLAVGFCDTCGGEEVAGIEAGFLD